MAIVPTARLFGRLQSSSNTIDGDEALLRRFRDGDQAAFAEIVRRHGPVVLGTCRRMLSHQQDAEDAFQAAFIVLARKCGTIRDSKRLAGWLYAVAVRTSREIRLMRTRRERLVRTAAEIPDVAREDSGLADRDWIAVFDEELARVPEHYRMPLIMCEIQGHTRTEAAAALHIPEGTLSSRLAKARRLLATRLQRRGIAAPAAGMSVLAGLNAAAQVPSELLTRTMSGLRGTITETATTVAERVIKAMWLSKLQTTVLVAAMTIGLGTVVTVSLAGEGSGGAVKRTTAGIENATSDELVDRLGSPRYVHREEAAKQLERIGFAADSALKRGTNHRDPEIQQRAADLRQRIRKAHLAQFREAFLRDSESTAKLHHPLWDRFTELVGNDPTSRALFVAILKDERGLARLAEAEMLPERAATLYGEELEEQFRALPSQNVNWGGGQQGMVQQQRAIPQPRVQQKELLGEYDAGHEHAIVFFLGTFCSPRRSPENELSFQNSERWHLGRYPRDPDAQAAGRRLYARWLEHRETRILCNGLESTSFDPVAELLPLARKVATDTKRTSTERIAGFTLIARLGSKEDLPLVTPLVDDKTVSHPVQPGEQPQTTHQVRDWARAAQLLLSGIEPETCGFRIYTMSRSSKPPEIGNRAWGFANDTERTAAHEKAIQELAKLTQ